VHVTQFSHPEDGRSTSFRNIGMFNYYTVRGLLHYSPKKSLTRTFYICGVLRSAAAAAAAVAADGRQWVS